MTDSSPEALIFGNLELRRLSSIEEYEACTEFQEEVWGGGFSERVPSAILMIANRIGGLTAGAFDEGGVLQGFVFGLSGIVGGETVHWSDMLAVREGSRDKGLGTRLKLYQREVLLGQGIRRMHWTFDPLQGRNAYVNFSKLGIVCREYVRDMYGVTDSPLHRGVGTDRLVAIWDMDSKRVAERVGGGSEKGEGVAPEDLPRVLPFEMAGDLPVPGSPVMDLSHRQLLLTIPGSVDEIMEADLSLAVKWREATRAPFVHYLSRGYEVRELLRESVVSSYLLVRPGDEIR